jgi:hypothetical protein
MGREIESRQGGCFNGRKKIIGNMVLQKIDLSVCLKCKSFSSFHAGLPDFS